MERNVNMKSTAARLRKTFQYPTDESSSNTPEALDEEEQETFIATLTEQNQARNQQFRQLLMVVPAIASIPYLLYLLLSHPSNSHNSRGGGGSSSSTTSLLSLLSLSSLASTAFLVWRLAPQRTGVDVLDTWTGAAASASSSSSVGLLFEGDDDDEGPDYGSSSSGQRSNRARRRRRSLAATGAGTGVSPASTTTSPLEAYLPYLNGVLCVLAFLTGVVGHGRAGGGGGGGMSELWLGCLPGMIYAAVVVAKVVMAGVDPERELGGLKYEYKGA